MHQHPEEFGLRQLARLAVDVLGLVFQDRGGLRPVGRTGSISRGALRGSWVIVVNSVRQLVGAQHFIRPSPHGSWG
ncbi:hypothetical protein C1N81_03410 (plasmid) [Streptomyces sp. SGAir0957]